jgi:hypothetical protein
MLAEQVLSMSFETEKDAVVAAYRAYTRAFVDNDIDAIDKFVCSSCLRCRQQNRHAGLLPVKPAHLMA